jgi:hypothetical protein
MKGWLQTAIAMHRLPVAALARSGGPRAALAVVVATANAFSPVLYPIGFVLLTLALIWPGFVPPAFDGLVMLWLGMPVVAMLLGVVGAAMGARRCGLARLAPLALLSPLYALAVSAASLAAVVDLVRAPHHWAKTEHGAARRISRPGRPAPAA